MIQIGNEQLTHTAAHKGIGHRRTGATSTQLHNCLARCIAHLKVKALPKTPQICVVATRLALAEHYRIDRPDTRSTIIDLVEMWHDRLFVRIGDVQPREAEQRCRLQDLGNAERAVTGHGGIDKLIGIAHAVPRALDLMHTRRARPLDVATHQTNEHRRTVLGRHGLAYISADRLGQLHENLPKTTTPTSGGDLHTCSAFAFVVAAVNKGKHVARTLYELVSLVNGVAAGRQFVVGFMSEIVSKTGKKATAKTRAQDPEGTKRNIIEVAMREFADNGLSGARIDEIAAKTNASKRMIYYYFDDKDGLYLRCLEEAYRVVRSGEVELNLDHLSPTDALRRLVEFTFEHHNSHPNFIRMVMIENIHNGMFLERSVTIQQLNATAIDNLKRIYQRGVEAGVFRKGIEPLDLHWHISALCFFNVSNRATFSRIFERAMEGDREQARLRNQVVAMILRFVIEPTELAAIAP